jgi:hypothetical protein
MHPIQMTKKVRVRCGVCSTDNVAVEDPLDDAPGSAPGRRHRGEPA